MCRQRCASSRQPLLKAASQPGKEQMNGRVLLGEAAGALPMLLLPPGGDGHEHGDGDAPAAAAAPSTAMRDGHVSAPPPPGDEMAAAPRACAICH